MTNRQTPSGFSLRVSDEPRPPSKIVQDLILAGAINPETARLPELDRCRCGHVPGAHAPVDLLIGPGLGRCGARKCPCIGYDQDPLFEGIPRGPAITGSPENVRKYAVTQDGRLKLLKEAGLMKDPYVRIAGAEGKT